MKIKSQKVLKRLLIYFITLVVFIVPITPLNGFNTQTVSAATTIMRPKANLQTGVYVGKQTIKLSCETKGAVIYYTIDGSKPSTKAKKYTKSFIISKSCAIRAIAVKNNSKSKEFIQHYIIYNNYSEDVERYETAIKTNSVDQLSEIDQEICTTVQNIINENITEDMSEYEKVKSIHDYIINNTRYDYSNYLSDTIPDVSYTIKGVIIDGVAVCQGYAETFLLFMNLLGIENKFIVGYGNGVSHAWNLVRLEGDWYHVDTTWDDPISKSGKNLLEYDYFLINDTQMSLDHVWETTDYPTCTSEELMYALYDGCIIDSIDDYESKFVELYNNGQRTITILYPENEMPDLDFYFTISDAEVVNYYHPVKFGDYYIFTVLAE